MADTPGNMPPAWRRERPPNSRRSPPSPARREAGPTGDATPGGAHVRRDELAADGQGRAGGEREPDTRGQPAAVLTARFVRAELRTNEPLLQVRLLARPLVLAGVAMFFISSGTVGVLNLTVPSFLQAPAEAGNRFGDSVLVAGLAMVPFAAVTSLSAAATGVGGAVVIAALTPVLAGAVVRVGPVMLPTAQSYAWSWLLAAGLAAAGAVLVPLAARRPAT